MTAKKLSMRNTDFSNITKGVSMGGVLEDAEKRAEEMRKEAEQKKAQEAQEKAAAAAEEAEKMKREQDRKEHTLW